MNLESIRENLKKYIGKKYDMADSYICKNYVHSLRVSHIARQIAISIDMDERGQDIAEITGLFHEIGRFEQVKRFHTVEDSKSVNHGELGYQILLKEIVKYGFDAETERLILSAVRNHEKTILDENMDASEKLFSTILRDADKLDLFNMWSKGELPIVKVDGNISDQIYFRIMNGKIDYEQKANELDQYALVMGLVYDLNYSFSVHYVVKYDLMKGIVDQFIRMNPHERVRFEKMYEKIMAYLKEREEEHAR